MTSTAIRAFFGSRSEADKALQRLEAEGVHADTDVQPAQEADHRGLISALGDFFLPEREVARAEAREGLWIVTARRTPPERSTAAAQALRDAGALRVERTEDDQAWTDVFGGSREPPQAAPPRAVQPGFADAPPGIVPGPAPDAGQAPDVKGRFADQLDRLPEEPGDRVRDGEGQGGGARREPVPAAPQGSNVEAVPAGTPGAGENVCRVCAGSGRVGDEPCPDCDGSGKVTTPIGGG